MDRDNRIIGIGLSGLVGTRIQEILKNQFEFFPFSTEQGIDITDPSSLGEIADHSASKVLLLAAKADVDGCEADRNEGENGAAWKINVDGAKNVIEACKRKNKKIFYISTDFVFNGSDTPANGYTEKNHPDPINWYGKTKFEAEKLVKESGLDFSIIRLAYPYRAEFDLKKDFFRAIRDRLQSGLEVRAITDHYFSPTFLDDFARALGIVFDNQGNEIYHLVGSGSITPYEAAQVIAKAYNLDTNLIQKTTREEYFKGKALRPFNLHLNNDRIKQLGCQMRNFESGLEAILQRNKI